MALILWEKEQEEAEKFDKNRRSISLEETK